MSDSTPVAEQPSESFAVPASDAAPAPSAHPHLLLPSLLAVVAALHVTAAVLDVVPEGAGAAASAADAAVAALAFVVAAGIVLLPRLVVRDRRAAVTALAALAALAGAASAGVAALRAVRTGDAAQLAGVVPAILVVAAVPLPGLAIAGAVATQVPFALAVALHRGGASSLAYLVALDAAVLAAAFLQRRRIDALRTETDEIRASARRQAVVDHLTGAQNRRGLELMAVPMIEHARRQGEAVHCLHLDLDHFRRVNEELGREEGDALLIAACEAVAASVRTTDVVARLDTDRFVVLGPGTGTSPLEMERRVRQQLEDEPPVPAEVWEVGVSIGSATLVPWDEGGLDVLLRRAEEDMRLRRSLRRQSRHRSRAPRPGDGPVPPTAPPNLPPSVPTDL